MEKDEFNEVVHNYCSGSAHLIQAAGHDAGEVILRAEPAPADEQTPRGMRVKPFHLAIIKVYHPAPAYHILKSKDTPEAPLGIKIVDEAYTNTVDGTLRIYDPDFRIVLEGEGVSKAGMVALREVELYDSRCDLDDYIKRAM